MFQGFPPSAFISPLCEELWICRSPFHVETAYIGGTGVIDLCSLRRQKAFPHHIFATTVTQECVIFLVCARVHDP